MKPHGNHGRGSHWIRDEKRHRIYERDGWCCIWCCQAVGAAKTHDLTVVALACLDHVLPRAKGGTNEPHNLVTSCMTCNEARGDRSAVEWCYSHWGKLGGARLALARLLEAMIRPLPAAKVAA